MRTKRDISQPCRLYASLNHFISATVRLSAEEERALVCDESAEASDQLILSHLSNVVYVKWEDTQLPDGTLTKYASEISGGDSTIRDQVSEGILPPGVQVLDMEDMDAS